MTRPARRPARLRTRGFGLVEIMIAMTLGLFLLAGMYEVYLANKRTYRTQEALARLQENARYVIHTLNHDLRMAGYAGCLRLGDMTTNIISTDPAVSTFDPNNFIVGANDVTNDGDLVLDGTDTVTIKGASGDGAHLTGNVAPDNANLQMRSNPANLQQGDIAIVSDCGHADIFTVTDSTATGSGTKVTLSYGLSTGGSAGNSANRLSKTYGTDAQVLAFRVVKYFVRNSGTATFSDGTPIPALWRKTNSSPAVELVLGVQNMQIEYGVNTDGDIQNSADKYVSANSVADWSKVVSVRVALLMESLMPATDTPDPTSYTLLSQSIGSFSDRRLRRTITFTVAIRNRVH